jgi:hypothetical protein
MAITVHGENGVAVNINANSMRVDAGGGIITEGLIRHYDFANTDSYPGTGNTWTDLSTSNISATTTNGTAPPYTTSRLGGLVFNGSASVGPIPSIPYVDLGADPFAVDVWLTFETNDVYVRGNLSCADLWSAFAPGDEGWGIGYDAGNNLFGGVRLSTGTVVATANTAFLSPSPGQVINIFIHRNTNTQVIETYINGSRRVTSNVSNAISLTGNRNPITATTWEATAVNSTNWRPLTTFHSIKLYQNKNFTAREILKNYNALAPRFGLI